MRKEKHSSLHLIIHTACASSTCHHLMKVSQLYAYIEAETLPSLIELTYPFLNQHFRGLWRPTPPYRDTFIHRTAKLITTPMQFYQR